MTYRLQRCGSFTKEMTIDLDKNEVTIGRKANPELKRGLNVSRKHASLFKTSCGEYYIKDLNSTNGVFVNGVKIGEELFHVKVGDIVGLGTATGKEEADFVFKLINAEVKEESSPSDDDCIIIPDVLVEVCAQQQALNNSPSHFKTEHNVKSPANHEQAISCTANNVCDMKNNGKSLLDLEQNINTTSYPDSCESESSIRKSCVWKTVPAIDEVIIISSDSEEEECLQNNAVFPGGDEPRLNETLMKPSNSVVMHSGCDTTITNNNPEIDIFVPESLADNKGKESVSKADEARESRSDVSSKSCESKHQSFHLQDECQMKGQGREKLLNPVNDDDRKKQSEFGDFFNEEKNLEKLDMEYREFNVSNGNISINKNQECHERDDGLMSDSEWLYVLDMNSFASDAKVEHKELNAPDKESFKRPQDKPHMIENRNISNSKHIVKKCNMLNPNALSSGGFNTALLKSQNKIASCKNAKDICISSSTDTLSRDALNGVEFESQIDIVSEGSQICEGMFAVNNRGSSDINSKHTFHKQENFGALNDSGGNLRSTSVVKENINDKIFIERSDDEEGFTCSESIENITKYINNSNNFTIKALSTNCEISPEANEQSNACELTIFSQLLDEHWDEAEFVKDKPSESSIQSRAAKQGKDFPIPFKSGQIHEQKQRLESCNKQKRTTEKRTMLTEPKSIAWRPRKRRGREEWFVDRSDLNSGEFKRDKLKHSKKEISSSRQPLNLPSYFDIPNAVCNEKLRQDNPNVQQNPIGNKSKKKLARKGSRMKVPVKHHGQLERNVNKYGCKIASTEENSNEVNDGNTKTSKFSESNKEALHKNKRKSSYSSTPPLLKKSPSALASSSTFGSIHRESKIIQDVSPQIQCDKNSSILDILLQNPSRTTCLESESHDLLKHKLSYESFDDYINIFHTNLLTKMRNDVSKLFKENQHCSVFHLVVSPHLVRSKDIILECQSILNSNMTPFLSEECLVVLTLQEGNIEERFLGFVFNCEFKNNDVNNNGYYPLLKNLPESRQRNAVWCKFFLKILKPSIQKQFQIMKAKVILSLTAFLHLFQSLLKFKFSPLVNKILRPLETNYMYSGLNPENLSVPVKYDGLQSSAIASISEEIIKCSRLPCIHMIQGPPATGKTHIIVGIILNLLHNKDIKAKILVTAPSNSALDEIGRRLKNMKEVLQYYRRPQIRFVRVGQQKHIHCDVRPYALDSLVNSTLQKEDKSVKESYSVYLNELQGKINAKKLEISSLLSRNEFNQKLIEKRAKLAYYEKQYEKYSLKLNSVTLNKLSESPHNIFKEKVNLLQNADVVLATLSGCQEHVMEVAFGKQNAVQFSCCLIDDSIHCSELEALQPLKYGMHKLVLVGDQEQLQLREDIEVNYSMSLFQRIYINFQNSKTHSPVFLLSKQYRMHSEICSFPSSYFYANGIKTASEIDNLYETFPLKPYSFFDISSVKLSSHGKSLTAPLYVEAISIICKEVLSILPEQCSIGVIVCNQKQSVEFQTLFKNDVQFRNIEVGTVDYFNGREKDVIVVSAINVHNSEGSINFLTLRNKLKIAITRARKCLLICGDKEYLNKHCHWQILIADAFRRNTFKYINSLMSIPLVIQDIKNSYTPSHFI